MSGDNVMSGNNIECVRNRVWHIREQRLICQGTMVYQETMVYYESVWYIRRLAFQGTKSVNSVWYVSEQCLVCQEECPICQGTVVCQGKVVCQGTMSGIMGTLSGMPEKMSKMSGNNVQHVREQWCVG